MTRLGRCSARRRSGRAAADPDVVDDKIARLCGRLPLALAVAAARAAPRPRLSSARSGRNVPRTRVADLGRPRHRGPRHERPCGAVLVGRAPRPPAAARRSPCLACIPARTLLPRPPPAWPGPSRRRPTGLCRTCGGQPAQRAPARPLRLPRPAARLRCRARQALAATCRTAVGRMLDHYSHTARDVTAAAEPDA